MGAVTVISGQTGYVLPSADYNDSGWLISESHAIHYPCNPGYMTYQGNLPLVDGQQYDITYVLDQYVSGGVYPLFGSSEGINRTQDGTYTETLTYHTGDQLQFYSDGYLRVTTLQIAEHGVTVPFTTVAFCEGEKKWSTFYSYDPEMMVRFGDNFITFKNGEAWLHDSNDTYNNFYSVQGSSKVTFYINLDAEMVKNFVGIRQFASSAWGSPNNGDIQVLPYKGKANGQLSRLKAGNYKNLQGDFYADFLRDLSDPRFNNVLDALFKGAELQGKVLEITLENDDLVQARLVEVDVTTSPQNYTR